MSDRGRTCRRSFDARRLSDPLLEPFQGTIEFHPRTRVEHVESKFRIQIGRARRWKAVIGGSIFSREPFKRAIRKNDWYEARVGVPVRGGG